MSTVLVVDDSTADQRMVGGLLRKDPDLEVIFASNGKEGLEQLERHVPDVVVTDMMMPRMGGFPVLEYVRTLDNPPKIIMITANEGGRHKAYAEMLGIDDYLRKPFAMDVMLDAVERVLNSSAPRSKTKRAVKKKG